MDSDTGQLCLLVVYFALGQNEARKTCTNHWLLIRRTVNPVDTNKIFKLTNNNLSGAFFGGNAKLINSS